MHTSSRRRIRTAGNRTPRWATTVAFAVALAALLSSVHMPPSTGSATHPVPGVRSITPALPETPLAPSLAMDASHPSWINVTDPAPATSPPWGGTAAYDPSDGETVYFGGCWDAGCYYFSNTTWVFAHGKWTNETNPSDAPPARTDGSMDYDANAHAILLFGGYGYNGLLGDTWIFHAGEWTNVSSYGPSPRYYASLAFDPQSQENGSVLFGGFTTTGYYANDTWVWRSGSGWVELSPSSAPPEMCCGAMAYDAADGYLVLFGGYSSLGKDLGQTWEFTAGDWSPLSPSGPPAARYDATMVYSPADSGTFLFGGDEGGVIANDTWIFSGDAWTDQSPASAPPAEAFDTALDGTGTTPLAVGAEVKGTGSATWAYEVAPTVLLEANESSPEAGESVLFSADVEGGTSPYGVTFDFGDGSSAFVYGTGPEVSVAHAFTHNGTFEVKVNLTDAVGVSAVSTVLPFVVAHGPAVSAASSVPSGDVGSPIGFRSDVVSPGATPYSYSWSFGDGGSASTANASHTYSTSGVFTVRLNLTDAAHARASASTSVTVVPDPSVSVAASGKNLSVGASVTLWANVTGGTAPFSYAWRFADGGSSTLPEANHSYASAGTYEVQVWVNDSDGLDTHGTVTLSVSSPSGTSPPGTSPPGTSPPGPSAPAGSTPWWFWTPIAAIAAALVVGSVLLIRGRRRGS